MGKELLEILEKIAVTLLLLICFGCVVSAVWYFPTATMWVLVTLLSLLSIRLLYLAVRKL